MKTRTKSISQLRLEIEDLEDVIKKAKCVQKLAFAGRLEKIKELKIIKLSRWVRSQ